MRPRTSLLLAFVPALAFAHVAASPAAAAERVIFDTDVGGDDAGALAVLHALADRGEVEILAVGVVIGHELGVPYIDAVNTWYGRPDIPISSVAAPAPYSRDEYMAGIVEDYPTT